MDSTPDLAAYVQLGGLPGAGAPFPTLWISGPSNVTLRSFDIDGAGHFGVLASSSSTVLLEWARITGGSTGVSATGGSTVTIGLAANIELNGSTDPSLGGGVTCSGSSRVNLEGTVNLNSAIEGGGIRASENCFIELIHGWVLFNSATRGGGVFLESGAFLGGGGDTQPSYVRGNEADDGGGFYVTGNGTRASVFNLSVTDNEADLRGGGVYATEGGEFSMNRSTVVPCFAPPRCSELSGNKLALLGSTDGSAAFASHSGSVTLLQTYVEGNSTANEAGDLLRAETTGHLQLEGVQIWGNTAAWLFSTMDAGTATAAFVSAAQNEWLVSGSTYASSHGARTELAGTVDFFSSIVVDTSGGYSGSVSADCTIVDDLTGLSSTSGATRVSDPGFMNAAAGDLHLRYESDAIDSCDTSAFVPTRRDIDLDHRGFDRSEVPNQIGPVDLGFDEALGLFWDGFESGDASLWSQSP